MDLKECFPYFTSGEIVKGFGRGSKELGFPTANFSHEVTDSLPETFPCGVYYGWAKVDDGPVNKMVMSVGYNIFYQNKKRTMEAHILYDFKTDLYGRFLKICILGYLRKEMNFKSIDGLIDEIKNDIKLASALLDGTDMSSYRNHEYFEEGTR